MRTTNPVLGTAMAHKIELWAVEKLVPYANRYDSRLRRRR